MGVHLKNHFPGHTPKEEIEASERGARFSADYSEHADQMGSEQCCSLVICTPPQQRNVAFYKLFPSARIEIIVLSNSTDTVANVCNVLLNTAAFCVGLLSVYSYMYIYLGGEPD